MILEGAHQTDKDEKSLRCSRIWKDNFFCPVLHVIKNDLNSVLHITAASLVFNFKPPCTFTSVLATLKANLGSRYVQYEIQIIFNHVQDLVKEVIFSFQIQLQTQ